MPRDTFVDAPRFFAALASLVILVATATTGLSQQSKIPPSKNTSNAKTPKTEPPKPAENNINAPFADPDVKAFVKRFESESREVYSRREEIVKALAIKPGMSIADIGAGTGLFTRLFAREVGAEGRVYAVDISPAFLKHIDAESKRLKQKQVRTIKATQNSTGLTPNTLDLAFLCDVYHHLERPGDSLRSIHDALKTTGNLVVIDFDRVKGKSSEFVLKHVRADRAQFVKEIQSAGFQLIRVSDAPRLDENFFVRFRKIHRAPTDPEGRVGE